MQASFELEKNKKAFLYTLIICTAILVLAFIITFPVLKVTPPLIQDLIEVNLGNNNDGFGDEQPLIKGAMNNDAAPEPTPQSNTAPPTESSSDPTPEDDAEADAATVTKPTKPITKPTTTITPTIKQTVKQSNTTTAKANIPKPQKAVALYKNNGKQNGNNADKDNGFKMQGKNKDGKNDEGKENGKPDSFGKDDGGKTGVSVTKGAKPLNLGALKFEDDFNENAKVYIDVKYNSAGICISATAVKPTTTTNSTILGIARRKAASLKFPPSDDGGVSTILFNFTLKN
jgi:cytoskeletal protein RodZ